MTKNTLLTLLFAMKIEFGVVLLTSLAYGLGVRVKIDRHWLVRIIVGWMAITVITFLIFVYVWLR